jgi:hypothetical protein
MLEIFQDAYKQPATVRAFLVAYILQNTEFNLRLF